VSTNQPTLAPAHDLQGDGWPKIGMVSGLQDSEPANSARSRPGVEHDPTVTNQQGRGLLGHELASTKTDEDRTAVTAGLTLKWSNGATEGQSHRLKLVTRQGDGRAGFALLRQRVLSAA
jgi:hypothetical protein